MIHKERLKFPAACDIEHQTSHSIKNIINTAVMPEASFHIAPVRDMIVLDVYDKI